MIVTCERCDSRFQLDDARIPAAGARVRCSRCKHAFLVAAPGASEPEAIHALAAAAARDAAPTLPSVTRDLPAPTESAAQDLPAPTESAAQDEDEWQFADAPEPASVRRPRAERTDDPWEGILEDEKPPETRELDALGSPESWSFVSGEASPLHSPGPSGPVEARTGMPSARVVLGRLKAPVPAAAEVVPELAAPRSQALDRVGWVLTGLLLLAIVHGIDWTGSPPSGSGARSVPLGEGLVIEDLSLRRLENSVAGPVLVIGGVVVNPGERPLVRPGQLSVRVVSPQGEIEALGWPPRSPEGLRDLAPSPEAGRESPLLAEPLGPGSRRPFEAVIPAPPQGDSRLELRLVPAPGASSSEAAEKQERAAPATGDPSPPSLLPSSG